MASFFKWDQPSRYDRKKEQEAAEAAAWRAVCKLVDVRDKKVCRACGRLTDPDAVGTTKRGERHHVVYRSAGGEDVSSNLVTLCAGCHNDEHRHRLEIRGNADEKLEFWRLGEDGWYLDRREIAPHVIEKD